MQDCKTALFSIVDQDLSKLLILQHFVPIECFPENDKSAISKSVKQGVSGKTLPNVFLLSVSTVSVCERKVSVVCVFSIIANLFSICFLPVFCCFPRVFSVLLSICFPSVFCCFPFLGI